MQCSKTDHFIDHLVAATEHMEREREAEGFCTTGRATSFRSDCGH
jgi:hypothetical protein